MSHELTKWVQQTHAEPHSVNPAIATTTQDVPIADSSHAALGTGMIFLWLPFIILILCALMFLPRLLGKAKTPHVD